MWQSMIGPAISAGADLVGGFINKSAAKEASDTQWKREKKVLQNSIQWRVEDAVKAGLHPLVGAGISPSSGPAPTAVGDMGAAVSNMGNNIGRAADALLAPEDKYSAKVALLDLEQRQANLDLTRSQLAGAQKALLTSGATPGVASIIPGPVSDVVSKNAMGLEVSQPGLNDMLQPHYGEMADVMTAPRAVYDMARRPGNIFDPALSQWIRDAGSNTENVLRAFEHEPWY